MAPALREFSVRGQVEGTGIEAGERIVISGVSGLFPDARHVADLADILYNRKNPVTSKNLRWKFDHPEVSKFVGKVPGVDLFDAQFFKVHYRLGNAMDAMARKILEQAYQAIYDAGVNPAQLSGKKVAVFIGICFSESEKSSSYTAATRSGFGISGCNKSMFANRISYWLNLKGPSMAIDDMCCSSTTATELAFQAITRGECDAAIVGGTHLILHPQSFIHCSRVMNLSKDGTTKSFDENATGCANSESINVMFLQKAKDALRIYAEITYIKTEFTSLLEDETGPKYGFCRDPLTMTNFLKKFYDEAQIPTHAIEFIEAFGSATPEADKQELEAISNVFCENRHEPLLVGSVMSNIGYAEAASGINSITKVILGYHTGELAGNLNCAMPRRDVAALHDGRLRILTEHTRFQRSYVAINGLSVTGVNTHIVLHGRYKPKDLSRYKCNIPYLVTISGRKESAVLKILNDLKTRPIDPEELALLHNIHQNSISGHLGRGFIILDKDDENKTMSLSEKANYIDVTKRPLWFVYSGMGSQWVGMGEHLMRIPIFATAIERCRRVLEPKGVNIVNIITSRDNSIFDSILNSFVGIAAIQIGLTDILRAIGLVPDKIIGHSAGELGCAYADGCFTAEEMILSAYSRGLVSLQTQFIQGSMAAVGIGFQQISSMCPPEIEVACHNGPDSCTISGPADAMREFVTQLSAQNIFAKEVPCSNIAYHSRYIAEAGPELLRCLKEVIRSPKLRSPRWVSTSVPKDKWHEDSAKYSSAEYHTNNLLRPVLFEETSQLIPLDAVLVEIAPHGLLQAILKRSLPATCRNVPLTHRGHPDNARFLLEAIGELYTVGFYPRIQALYPKIEFPVSTGTPMLSHLIEWIHDQKWLIPLFKSAATKKAATINYILSIHDEEHRYLEGNVVNGKIVYPFAAALVAVWDTLAMTSGATRWKLGVQFREVVLHAQPVLHERRQLHLAVALQRGTGRFEVMDDHSIVASGIITTDLDNSNRVHTKFDADEKLDQTTIYEMLSMRNFSYRNEFRSIHSTNTTFSEALILWRENWVTLLDGMLQLQVLRHPHKTVSVPTSIRKIIINVTEHEEDEYIEKAVDLLKVVNISEDGKIVRCKGIVMEDVLLHDLPTTFPGIINLKALKCVPHFQFEKTDITTAMHVFLQIVAENVNKDVINVLELNDGQNKTLQFKDIEHIVCDIPGVMSVYKRVEWNKILKENDNILNNFDIVLVSGLATNDHLRHTLQRVLARDTFIVNKENTSQKFSQPALYRVVCSYNIGSGSLELARWRPTASAVPASTVSVRSPSDLDLLAVAQASLLPQQKLLVLSSYPPIPGIKSLIKHYRKEYNRKISLAMINHKTTDDQDVNQVSDIELTFNILDHGKWGGEYYVPLQNNKSLSKEVTLRCARQGDLKSLCWVQAPKSSECDVKVTVHYAGVSDLDMKRATGLILFDGTPEKVSDSFGMDFSGVTETGDRVMGIIQRGAISSSLHVKPNQLWPIPAHWSLEDAATVPLAYCLAYYCLLIKSEIHPHMRVLVHGGAGALGQAAISIALAHDCEVFTTVSSLAKKIFLLKLFPNLKAENVGNSRDITFGDMVLEATKGQGVDITICCVKGELKTVSLKITAHSGTVFDVAQIYNRENYAYGMFYMTKQRSYVRVDLLSIFNEENRDDMKRLQRLVTEGIAHGWVRPLSHVVYEPCDVSRAFHLLAGGNQRGRALLRLHTMHTEQIVTPSALPRLQCSSELYHLIICDDELTGLQLAEKLISRGVRKLLLSRFAQSLHLDFKRRLWQENGVQVNELTEDVSTLNLEPSTLSALEGVYVVFNERNKTYEFTSMLSNLDSLTRQAYSPVKYFAIISTDNSFGEQIYNSRTQDRLPATIIKVPAINKLCGAVTSSCHEEISSRQVAVIVEQVLCSSESNLLAHVNVAAKPSFLTQLGRVADINIPKDVTDNSTLSDLGMKTEKSNILHAFLRDMYNVSLAEEELPNVTIQTLRDIDASLQCVDFENVTGLKAFYTYVDSDELLASTEMVMMPTLSSGLNTQHYEFDVNETYMFIVPGVEGHHARFRTLCERLKLPAVVLQPGLHHPHDTVYETAQRYAQILLEKIGQKTNFYLLGYESGVLVALELAAILEDHGLIGTVFCLGPPPVEINKNFRECLPEVETEDALQDAIVRHMFMLMTGNEGEELNDSLRGVTLWREKVEVAVRLLLGRVPHSAQYARQLMESARGRLATMLHHNGTAHALRSRLVLLRPAPATACTAALQPHSQQPVTAHALRAPLALAPQDLRCAAIINSYLDDNILQAFQQKNLCESYLITADSFDSSVE